MQIPSKRWLPIGAGLLLVAAAAYVGSWALFDGNNVRQGSLAYFVGVPAAMKDRPIIEACTAARYRWQGRDGESAPFIAVTYSSGARAEILVKAYENDLKSLSCKLISTDASGPRTIAAFDCDGHEFVSANLAVGSEAPCVSVELGLIESY